jgi:hypothetical protein
MSVTNPKKKTTTIAGHLEIGNPTTLQKKKKKTNVGSIKLVG